MTGSWETAERRRVFFEESAAAYDRFRPGYPKAMYEDLARLTGIGPGAEVVEVGSGTGLSSEGLIALGCRLRCIEPATRMAEVARARLGDSFELVAMPFEEWDAPGDSADLVFSATAWMWVRQEVGFAKAQHLLRRSGQLALSWQTLTRLEPDGLQERLEAVYDDVAPEMRGVFHAQQTVHSGWPERIAGSGRFTAPETLSYAFSRRFDARSFVAATFTYGMHGDLSPDRLALLAERLEDVIASEFDGTVDRYEETFLYLSRPV